MRNSTHSSPVTGWIRDVVLASAFVAATAAAHQAYGQVETVTVQGIAHREVIELQGASVHGFQDTEIRAKLGGYVKTIGIVDKLEVDVGSRVKKGDVLVELDIPEMQNTLAEKTAVVAQRLSAVVQAEAAIAEADSVVLQSRASLDQINSRTAEKQAMLKLNETKLRRLSGLAAAGTIGQDNLDEARFDVDVARAALASVKADVQAAKANIQAAEASVRKVKADKKSAEATVTVARSTVDRLKTMMEYTILRAPYDGVVTKRKVDLGSYVQPAENNSAAMPVFELTQISKVRIMVAVPNNNVGKVQPGQAVIFDSIGGLEGQAFAGKVTRTAGILDPKTRTMQIEVHLENPVVDTVSGNRAELKPGLYGTLTVVRKDWKGDDLLPVVPTTAVGKDSAGNYFVIVVENGKPSRRKVVIAFNDAASVGISDGLKVGE
ncbi:MAG TPA: efflux RND transporter periplasmic adaptor subunit, partial [Fuerstia sp.]|nr:efflux RND transporter periplasmic adaptor subunit [Fuerstiella sp.]